MTEEYQVAIDGPAASGKSTVAKLVAKKLGGFYVNTGEMYRTLALGCLQQGIDPEANPEKVAQALAEWNMDFQPGNDGQITIFFNGKPVETPAIRAPEVAAIVSYVARISQVRSWLLQKQRDCRKLGTITMEGRDICTEVLKDATAKFFVTATPEERARRRFAQEGETAVGATVEQVAAEIAKRDLLDSTREVAPLKPAEDALTIVTDGMTPEQVADKIIDVFLKKKAAIKVK